MLRRSLLLGWALAPAALGVGFVPNASQAQTVDLSWHQCAPIVTSYGPAEALGVSFYASVTGHSEPHHSYQVWWAARDASGGLPDAWRFDVPSGCANGLYAYEPHELALAKSCPPLTPIVSQQLTIAKFQLAPPELAYPASYGVGFVANAALGGSPATDPGQRYMLARFYHEHAFSVVGPGTPDQTCGGYEASVCFGLIPERVTWTDTTNVEHRWALGNAGLVLHSYAGCPFVPARASTWGSIKRQYR